MTRHPARDQISILERAFVEGNHQIDESWGRANSIDSDSLWLHFMARRGKYRKLGGALGIGLLALIIAGQAIYTAVMQHLAETGIAVGAIALSALGWRAMRRRARTRAVANSNRIILNRTTAPLLSGAPQDHQFRCRRRTRKLFRALIGFRRFPRTANADNANHRPTEGVSHCLCHFCSTARPSPSQHALDIARSIGDHPRRQYLVRTVLCRSQSIVRAVKARRTAINSSLPIASGGSASTEGISYWPSYSGVTPPVRRAFLEWMASGKGDPSANVGLVFIYFYGLEYRLFKEGVDSDAGVLVVEVERLLKIYGANGSVQNYARAFRMSRGCWPHPRCRVQKFLSTALIGTEYRSMCASTSGRNLRSASRSPRWTPCCGLSPCPTPGCGNRPLAVRTSSRRCGACGIRRYIQAASPFL